MSEPLLRNYRILVVEDEFLLADELQAELEDAGATVIGPVGTLGRALALIEAEQQIDGASLDASLGGEMVFPAADLLMQRGVAIVFTTGYDASIIPSRFSDVPRCEKPADLRKVVQAIVQALQA
jgi:CheY-like chemotaxis protein